MLPGFNPLTPPKLVKTPSKRGNANPVKFASFPFISNYSILLLDKFDKCVPLPGFASSVMMMHHSTVDKKAKAAIQDSTVVKFETSMIAKICQHLLKNRLRPDDIQILSNCPSMRQFLGLALIDKDPDGVGRIPCRLGDEPNSLKKNWNIVRASVVLLSLSENHSFKQLYTSILRAAHESKEGIVILCHFELLKTAVGDQLLGLMKKMLSKGFIRPHLTLMCKEHNRYATNIRTPDHFQLASPLGGCDLVCRERTCGHLCFLVCHPQTRDHESHKDLWCRFPCDLTCPQGHPCVKLCFDKCSCNFNCKFTKACGHDADFHRVCFVPCQEDLPCGHKCGLKCYQCFGKDHTTLTCKATCERKCEKGHQCKPKHLCAKPCPPCKIGVTFELPCGHRLVRGCNDPEVNVRTYQCLERCNRSYGGCIHLCSKQCFEECGSCEVVSYKLHPECGHTISSRCHELASDLCMELVASRFPSKCGHPAFVPCRERLQNNSEFLARICQYRCIASGSACGHSCGGSCSECHQQRFHARCVFPCGRTLVCGHACLTPCPAFCPPCSMACFIDCEHSSCLSECGVPCELVCSNPCPYECPHFKCELTCAEPCVREGCFEPCPKKLECGHDCVGFCGEICPPYCRICDSKKQLMKGTLTEEILTDSMRFIFLVNCGHAVEHGDLDTWMKQDSERQQIEPKSCPVCRIPVSIRGLRRYAKIIMAANAEVNRVKRTIFGKTKVMKKVLEAVKIDVEEKLTVADSGFARLDVFGQELLDHVKRPLIFNALEEAPGGAVQFQSMYLDKALFIRGLHHIWKTALTRLQAKKTLWRRELLDNYEFMWAEFFNRLVQRQWPFHPNELKETHVELERMESLFLLYDCYSSDRDPNILKLAESKEGREKFANADSIIRQWLPYGRVREAFQEAFKEFCTVQTYTLEISDEERKEILNAFGGRSGRWFKCPKGHVYVVTECGGVTEVGQCNECGESIGGQNHSVLPGNALASEMDGAESPLYPTALARLTVVQHNNHNAQRNA